MTYKFICQIISLNMSSNGVLLLMFNARNRQMNYYVIYGKYCIICPRGTKKFLKLSHHGYNKISLFPSIRKMQTYFNDKMHLTNFIIKKKLFWGLCPLQCCGAGLFLSGSSSDNFYHLIKQNSTIFMIFNKFSCFLKT
jgi:hypothetical protein